MEYSEDFKNMVKAYQGKFIGYGNPNAKILIIVPKMDDDRHSILCTPSKGNVMCCERAKMELLYVMMAPAFRGIEYNII